jgi:hypothetical protein
LHWKRKGRDRQALAVAATDGSLVHRIQRILGLESSVADWQSAAVTCSFSESGSDRNVAIDDSGGSTADSCLSSASRCCTGRAGSGSGFQRLEFHRRHHHGPTGCGGARADSIRRRQWRYPGNRDTKGSSAPVSDVHVVITSNAAPNPKAVQDLVSYFASRGVSVTPPESGANG